MQKLQQNFRLQLIITILSVILFGAKIYAYYATHSLAILSDALESIVNVIAGFIGLFSLYVAAKPKDTEHPYGHGKAEFVSAAAEGALIMAAGIFVVFETVQNILEHDKIHSLDSGLWLVGITGMINALAGGICVKIGKKNGSPALRASGKHLLIDTYSTLTIIAGLVLMVLTNIVWMDKVIAFAMSIFIFYNGYKIIRSSLAGIMDEADMELLKKLVIILNAERTENWIDLHNFRIIKYGSQLHIDCHLTVAWYLNVNEAHKEIDALKKIFLRTFGDATEMFVHTDGCLPFSCSICYNKECTYRKKPFEKRVEWSLDNIILNKKHNDSGITKA